MERRLAFIHMINGQANLRFPMAGPIVLQPFLNAAQFGV
jgi:hypothetical protein